jgi:hypothetical protein
VIVSEQTQATIESRKAAGQSLWRVSSTLFGHIASDVSLRPLGRFATEESAALFPPIDAGAQVQDELNAIALGAGFNDKKRPKVETE